MDNLLEIRGLKIIFRLPEQEICAVNGVDLDVARGQSVVLAGESGSGKTITALSLTRILPPTASILSGSVKFSGRDLLRLEENALTKVRGKEIAYIFQEPTTYLNPVYTIGHQVMEAIILHQHCDKTGARKEALQLLARVNLKDPPRVMLDYPHQLSGGMNQRVFIAMALACKPKLLIADEPTTSLDVTVEAEILKLLMDLKKSLGFSLLFITHNLSIARRIADKISVMYRGKIVEEGTCDKIFRSPAHFHTKELIRAYELIGSI